MQEVGDEQAFEDLLGRLGGRVAGAGSPPTPTTAASASASSPRCRSTTSSASAAFPPGTDPVRLAGRRDDHEADGPRRPARARHRRHAVDLVTAHLKSKLLSYPRGRFSPRDEDERARYGGYALALRAAEAITLRHHATALLEGHGQERA